MPLSAAALAPLLRLALTPGIGAQRLGTLLRHFGSAERALRAPVRELEGVPGLGAALARRVAAGAPPERVSGALARLERVGAVAITPDDLAFPDAFRLLADPPYLLFASGDLELLRSPGVAVVGTRAPSDYGRATAAALAAGLARAGWVVASGMARGIDTAAHRAALEAGGGSVGVLGHGIDQVYPPENRGLFEAMRERGLLITELMPGEQPAAGNFPRRNRLIAALSQAVLVVEMGLRSGAQHTVSYALELGREVLAVPGPVGSPTSAGTNQLIRDGARLVTSVQDVVEELAGVGSTRAAPPRPEPAQPALPLLLPQEDRVLRALDVQPRHVDELCAAAGLAPGALLGVLLELELKGLTESLPGKHFRRV